MLLPESPLYIYEFEGDLAGLLENPPSSFLGLWNEEGFSYLFFSSEEDDYANERARSTGVRLGSRHDMAYKDWQTGVPENGIQLGGIMIVRPDHPCPPPNSIVLDPSVVFGDGDHPTTKACLDYFEAILATEDIQTVLDLGTGTGILALVAARLGVRQVVAVDRNILAVQTARENVKRNSLNSAIQVFLGEARRYADKKFDLVFANLPFSVLRDLLTTRGLAQHLRWIISGTDLSQAEVLQDLLREMGYTIASQRSDRPWVTFVAIL